MSPTLAEELAMLIANLGRQFDDLGHMHSEMAARRLLADPSFLRLAARVVLEKGRGVKAGSIVASYLRAVAEGGTP